MKILEIIPQLSSGGAERFVVDLCNELVLSNEVYLLVYHDLDEHGFYVSELSPRVNIINIKKNVGISISVFWKVYKIIQSIRPDVVHMHLRAILYVLPSILCYRKNTKYFMTIHSAADKEVGGRIGSIVRKICFNKQLVCPITISKESLDSFIAYYKFSAPLIFNGRSIPPKISISDSVNEEINSYKLTKSTKIIVHLARFNELKRQPLLAKVSKRLYEEGFDFTILMIGSTAVSSVLHEVQSIASPVVHILGERKKPLEYLAMADSYCLCSSYEGLPISLLEAMAVGALPVCTPVGGIVDLIKDGKNGILASDLSEDSLYAALKRFLSLSPDDYFVMKKQAMEDFKPYSMENCATDYLMLFNK